MRAHDFAADPEWHLVTRSLVERLLRDIPDPGLRAALEACAVVRHFDEAAMHEQAAARPSYGRPGEQRTEIREMDEEDRLRSELRKVEEAIAVVRHRQRTAERAHGLFLARLNTALRRAEAEADLAVRQDVESRGLKWTEVRIHAYVVLDDQVRRLEDRCQQEQEKHSAVIAELEEQQLTLEAARGDLREKLLPYDRATLVAEVAAQQESA